MSASSSDTRLTPAARGCWRYVGRGTGGAALDTAVFQTPVNARRPPGRWTGPCPCQSVINSSRAAVCRGGQWCPRRPRRPRRAATGSAATRAARPARRTSRRPPAVRNRRPHPAPARVATLAATAGSVSASSASTSARSNCRGPRQCLGDAALQHVLQQRQDLMPDAHTLERRVVVVRVAPRLQTEGRARIAGGDCAEGRATVAGRRPSAGSHARRSSAAPTRAQPQQHRLGLVVERVPEQHPRVERRGGRRQRRVARGASSRLRAAGSADVHAHRLHRIEAQLVAERGHPCRLHRRARLHGRGRR